MPTYDWIIKHETSVLGNLGLLKWDTVTDATLSLNPDSN